MVCSLGGAQMATLLDGGSSSQIMTEEVGRWKLAAQYVQRELREADEANLLDEEDMHIFGLRPMVDPLILVCCNSCKKPVKASQYAGHAEICKSLSSAAGGTLELDSGSGQRKPPRKERKKLQITHSNSTQKVSVGEPERATLTVGDIAASNRHPDVKTQMKTSFSIRAKGVTSGRAFPNGSDGVFRHQTPAKPDNRHLQPQETLCAPAPLATKIYYSQRNHRLRSSLTHMYYQSSSTKNDHGLQLSDGNRGSGYFHPEKIDDCYEKLGKRVSGMTENPNRIPGRNPEVILGESGACPPVNSSDRFHVNNRLGPERTASEFHQNPCLSAGN